MYAACIGCKVVPPELRYMLCVHIYIYAYSYVGNTYIYIHIYIYIYIYIHTHHPSIPVNVSIITLWDTASAASPCTMPGLSFLQFRAALIALMRGDPEGFVHWMGVLCSSWVTVSRGTTGRCLINPHGCEDVGCVRSANLMTSRLGFVGFKWVLVAMV